MLAVYALWHREILRFLKDRSRVFSSLGQPLIFWMLFAGALSKSFTPGGVESYGEYFFPGTLAMIVMFTSIFSTITVIEDRKEGFLQGVLIAPVPRGSIALGKILGAATLSFLHGLVFFAFAPLAGVPLTFESFLVAAGVLLLIAFALAAVGFTLAWLMDSTAGYHGIMMLFLMPMLLMSGAFFPADGAHALMKFLMTLNPLTYGVAALRHALYLGDTAATAGLPTFMVSLGGTIGFAAAAFVAGTAVVLRRTARDAI